MSPAASAGEMVGDEKGRCVRCREWQEHYFREHMDVSNIRFFKLMTGDFQYRIVSINSSICLPPCSGFFKFCMQVGLDPKTCGSRVVFVVFIRSTFYLFMETKYKIEDRL
jgi:hypothetical protein